MRTLVQSHAPSARVGIAYTFAFCAALAMTGCAAAESPRAAASAVATEASACLGGLCVHPDHVLARRTGEGRHGRCLVVAWDGDGSLPPTAHLGVTDGAPARPGVFAALDLPGFSPWARYSITSDPARAHTGAAVFAARVDPAVRFADQRVAEEGSVRVEPLGDAAIVIVTTTWGGRTETTQFTVPDATNECLAKFR
jgi:hypothetical protein